MKNSTKSIFLLFLPLVLTASLVLGITLESKGKEEKKIEVTQKKPNLSNKTAPPGKAVSSNKEPVMVQVSQIDEQLKKVLPAQLCSDDKQLMKCHKMTDKTCHKKVSEALENCIKSYKGAKALSAIESIRYGEQQGLCIRNKMGYFLKTIKRKCDYDQKVRKNNQKK